MSGSKNDSNKGLVTDLNQMGISEMFPEARLLLVINNLTESFLITFEDLVFLESTSTNLSSSFLGKQPTHSGKYRAWDFAKDFVGFVEYVSTVVEPSISKKNVFKFMYSRKSDEAKELLRWCEYIHEKLIEVVCSDESEDLGYGPKNKMDTTFFFYSEKSLIIKDKPNSKVEYQPYAPTVDLIEFLRNQPTRIQDGDVVYSKVPIIRYLVKAGKLPYDFGHHDKNPKTDIAKANAAKYNKAYSSLKNRIAGINRELKMKKIRLRIGLDEESIWLYESILKKI